MTSELQRSAGPELSGDPLGGAADRCCQRRSGWCLERRGSGRRSKIQGFSQVVQANQKAKEKEISESLERNVDKNISMKDKLQVKKMG